MNSPGRPAPLNAIWLLLIVTATITAAYTGNIAALTTASFDAAKSAVNLAIGLIGAMALWLGIMRVVEEAGIMRAVARGLRPLMLRLFPDVPGDHPAMSAMILNMAANALGLGNAATPMGIKAMHELEKLNPRPGEATNAMCLFLAINTSNVTLLPLGVITIRAAAGAASPAAILVPSIVATALSTMVAIIAAKSLARRQAAPAATAPSGTTPDERQADAAATAKADARADVAAGVAGAGNTDTTGGTSTASGKPDATAGATGDATAGAERFRPGAVSWVVLGAGLILFTGILVTRGMREGVPPLTGTAFWMAATDWLIPLLMCGFLITGWFRGVKVYESVTEGAKEGVNVAIRIIPYLVAIFVAIGMFRASGAMDILAGGLRFVLEPLGMPAEVLPMALMRPLSGSGAFGLMAEIVHRAPDGFAAFLASTLQGSTETTFYVLAVYFGSIGIRTSRHALPAALIADAAGIAAAVAVCRIMFPG